MSGAGAPGGSSAGTEPVSVLIGALGGEGGGVLTDWIVAAAGLERFPVQSTSIPGVAQRTGATTYYLEIFPVRRDSLNGDEPVLALYAAPGRVDVAVMSELVEAGRAMENGMVTPERTHLIASTHRVFAIAEKSAMADGRFDAGSVQEAAAKLARRVTLFDMAAVALECGSVINAVLLGAIAASEALPISRESFERAIREGGVAVESNLRGFKAGFERAVRAMTVAGDKPAPSGPAPERRGPKLPAEFAERLESGFPASTREVLREGTARLIDFQDEDYALEYLERLASMLKVDDPQGGRARGHALTRETGRHLALWMSYEDAIRVAQLKTRPARMARVRADLGAKPGEPMMIREFLDPGLEEIAAILPRPLARVLLALARRYPRLKRWRRPMAVRTDTVLGFFQLWLLARLRRIRRWSHRFAEEQALIGRWLSAVRAAAEQDYELGLETVQCARLIKGYGDTYDRGRGNFLRIYDKLLAPALSGGAWPPADSIRRVREAALADPEGKSLERALADLPPVSAAVREVRPAMN
jgi:indolepyruvate ferredoxin oxidoreductase beta subunit